MSKEQLIKEFRERFAPKAGKPVQGFHEELDIPTSITQKTTYYLATNPEVESFLLSAFDAGRASGIEESKCESAAEVITDLYEIRVSLFKPIRLGEKHEIEDMFRYNFFDAVIANLTDKYRISSEKMRDVMRKRIALTPSSSKDN